MKLEFLVLSLLFLASTAVAEPDVTEIRLGTPPPSAPIDRTKVGAVEQLLAARQRASIDPALAPHARALVKAAERVSNAILFGPDGGTQAAFNFHDEGIESMGSGRFQVLVYILFANPEGQVVESRDERLTFSKQGNAYVCTDIRTANVITWAQAGVRDAARAIGATREFDRAETFLRDWTAEPGTRMSYSLADVQDGADGTVVVQCLRFKARPGKRGFDVSTAPIVLSRNNDSIRIEPD